MTHMRTGEIANSAEYQMDEQFQKWQLFRPILVFHIEKKSRNFLIF